jgi:hypothetical protein
VELAAYSLADERPAPGQYLHLALYWRATGAPETRQDPKIRLALQDEQGNLLDSYESWPVPGELPAVWPSDRFYVSQAALRVPPDKLPNRMSLAVIPELMADGEPVAQSPVQVAELVGAGGMSPVEDADIPNPHTEEFASEIKFAGIGIPSSGAMRGAVLPIDLYWQVVHNPAQNYTVFIHLYDGEGKLMTQYDRLAGGETLPTSMWQPGQLWRDTYPLAIPPTLPAGTYRIKIGMYTWPSMQRLLITRDGQPVGDILDVLDIQIEP